MAKTKVSPIKIHRVIAGLSQYEVARAIGRSQPWLSLVERGFVIPNKPERRRLCKILGVNPSVLGFDGGVAA